MQIINNDTAQPKEILIAHVAMMAVNNANPIMFIWLLEASLLSVKAQSAKTDNSRQEASWESPPEISIGIISVE